MNQCSMESKNNNSSKKSSGNKTTQALLISREKSLQELSAIVTLLHKGWQMEALTVIKQLIACCTSLAQSSNTIKKLTNHELIPKPPLRYVTSTLFLRELWQYLISDPKGRERLRLLTGPITSEGTRIISESIPVELEIQNAYHVKADPLSTHFTLIDLNEIHGHQQTATAHSHIMHGKETTCPSRVDLDNQERLVQIQDDSIGIIVNLDGYVRAYSTWKPFDFDIHGKGFEVIEDEPMMKVFRLLPLNKENVDVSNTDKPIKEENVQDKTCEEKSTEGAELQSVKD